MPVPTTPLPALVLPPALPRDALLWFLGAPPVTSQVFGAVRERLGRGDLIPLFGDKPLPWPALVERLAERLAASEQPVLLVAHGLAVPVALRVQPTALLLINGPVTRVDPVTQALGNLGRYAPVFLEGLLLPAVWLAFLRSSAGLRRAVANPYVMDRDTVAALATSSVGTRQDRKAVARFLISLVETPPGPAVPTVPTVLAWGDEDDLYPSFEASFLESSSPLVRRLDVPGGRFGYPVERPWALAEIIEDILSESLRTDPATTFMS